MININSELMKLYEIENHDSYVNCIDDDEIREFYERYIIWLEKKITLPDSNYVAELQIMDKSIRCLAIQVPADVYKDVSNNWKNFKNTLKYVLK